MRPDGLRFLPCSALDSLRRLPSLRPRGGASILSHISAAEPLEAERLAAARRFREAIGDALRAARREGGLTLRDVASLSDRRFKPSALGGYERGERSISLERFTELSSVYGVPADRLLGQVLDRIDPEGRVEVVVDVTQLDLLPGQEPKQAAELVDRVISLRGELRGGSVSLRAGDLEQLALATRLTASELVRRLEPALQVRDGAK
jgi:transcriptional regulator with XRE-family HTH domain